MSFSADVKMELANYWPRSQCCRVAETYGLLLFCKFFSEKNIVFTTEIPEIAARFIKLLDRTCKVKATFIKSDGKALTVTVEEANERKMLAERFNSRKIEEAFFSCDQCKNAFIRGAFISCGTVSNPSKEYDLEFIIDDENISWQFSLLLKTFQIDPKITERAGANIVYLKESENIEDILTLMEAINSSLEVMNVKIYKNFRNKANRITNCETANISKTVRASVDQLTAINLLEKKGILTSLPKELYEAAILRRDNEDLALSELAAILGISRSGINHRLQRIILIAKELKK